MLPMGKMTTFLPAAGFLALLTSLTPACSGDSPARHGPLEIGGRMAVDFGRVFEGSLLEQSWWLEAREALAIRKVDTDCGCTLASLERVGPEGRSAYELGSALEPLERLELRARYDTRGRRGPARRSVTVQLASGGQPLVLSLAADVQPWLLLDPPELEFERILEGQGAEHALRVRSHSGEPFGLRATQRALPSWVTLEVRPTAADGAGRSRLWDVTVRLLPSAPRGTFSHLLELESDVPVAGPGGAAEERRYSCTPAWSLQVVGPVALSVPSLDFGLLRPQEVVSRSVRLESFDPSFELSPPRAALEPIQGGEPFPLGRTASVRTRPVGDAFDLERTLDGLDPEVQGTFFARLLVETGHPDLPILEALVRGVRAPEEPAREPRRP